MLQIFRSLAKNLYHVHRLLSTLMDLKVFHWWLTTPMPLHESQLGFGVLHYVLPGGLCTSDFWDGSYMFTPKMLCLVSSSRFLQSTPPNINHKVIKEQLLSRKITLRYLPIVNERPQWDEYIPSHCATRLNHHTTEDDSGISSKNI